MTEPSIIPPSHLVNDAAAKQHWLTLAMTMKIQGHQSVDANGRIAVHNVSLYKYKL